MTIDHGLSTALSDRYRIDRELGHGGMATVYLADDLKHGRKVALKVLRPELAAVLGAERFLAEIRVTASLQHPHILPLHDSGEAGTFLFYVMPYVEGESLRDRLNREKQLPLNDSIRITREAASALDYAHRHGIIHRDIKPENILLHEEQTFIADFGIALAVRAAGGNRMTETGLSLGTPHYMSPEQAMGERDLGPRSDIYALGSVAYEMLVGEPPFTGASAQAIVAKVLTDRPHAIRPLRSTVPPQVEEAVLRSLEKLPADRWSTAAEFAQALDLTSGESRAFTTAARATLGTDSDRGGQRSVASPRAGWIAAAVFAITAIVLAWRLSTSRPSFVPGTVRFNVALGAADRLAAEPTLALSPDGTDLVVSGTRNGKSMLFMRRMDRVDFEAIAGTEEAYRPFFSPDGRWVGFSDGEKLKKVPVDGGAAVVIADAAWGGGSWGPDGSIVYTPNYKAGLWRLPAGGGKAEAVTTPDTTKGELAHWWPQYLPDGRHVLFTNFSTPIERAKIEVLDLKTGKRKVLVEGGMFGRYASTGHLLYVRGETMLALRFDPDRLTTSGSAVPVVEDVATEPSNGVAGVTVSPNGTLAYIPASTFVPDNQPVWVDRTGAERPLLSRPGRYANPRLSPDGQRVAFAFWQPGRNSDVWIYETTRGILTRLTFNDAADFNPLWSADGRKVMYTSERPVYDLYSRTADATAAEAPVMVSQYDKYASSISPDGKTLAFSVSSIAASEIWLLPLDGSTKPVPFLQTAASLRRPAFSPNGNWLAYDSDESGIPEVYVQSFPDPARARRQVSIGGGADARWTQGGRELVYRHGDSVMAVAVNPVSGETSRPTGLFVGSFVGQGFAANGYDVTPDGRRFLMIKQAPELAPRRVNVVINWFEELKRKTETGP